MADEDYYEYGIGTYYSKFLIQTQKRKAYKQGAQKMKRNATRHNRHNNKYRKQ